MNVLTYMKEQVDHYNAMLKGSSPQEVLSFFLENFPGKVAFSSSMGAEDQVITQMLAGLGGNCCIFTLDTGRMFAETYELIQKTQARYKLPIKVYFPDASHVEDMVQSKGINLFYDNVDNRKLCCHIRKILPLERALQGYAVWITGLRSQQSPTRTNLSVVEWQEPYRIIKVNPLLAWDEKQTWDYIYHHKIPFSSLHTQGYASIGCQPCTRPILPGEDVRAGRWWWESPQSKECGLHSRKA